MAERDLTDEAAENAECAERIAEEFEGSNLTRLAEQKYAEAALYWLQAEFPTEAARCVRRARRPRVNALIDELLIAMRDDDLREPALLAFASASRQSSAPQERPGASPERPPAGIVDGFDEDEDDRSEGEDDPEDDEDDYDEDNDPEADEDGDEGDPLKDRKAIRAMLRSWGVSPAGINGVLEGIGI